MLKYVCHENYCCTLTFLLMTSAVVSYNPDEDSTVKIFESHPLIQHPAGFDVRLKCGIRGNHENSASEVYWRFKPCGEGYNKSSCRESNADWQPVNCDGRCKATLLIKNPTENESGLYRCSIFPYKTDNHTILQIQIEKTYQLDVINYTIAPPEFIDDSVSNNVTSIQNSQVVFQCKIHSKVPPSIKWFRKRDTNTNSNHHKMSSTSVDNEEDEYYQEHRAAVKYFENTYDLLKSSGEKSVAEDTYLSKFIIESVTETDVGLYVCVGINYRGFKMREYFLSLQSAPGQSGSKNHLYLLFLIPVIFALIPLLLYCCFYMILRKNRSEALQQRCIQVYNSSRTESNNRICTTDTKYAVVNVNII